MAQIKQIGLKTSQMLEENKSDVSLIQSDVSLV